jgi:NAD(P)-dependent dehydrogenase (short-subunit alcohol dehydrogenase family)
VTRTVAVITARCRASVAASLAASWGEGYTVALAGRLREALEDTASRAPEGHALVWPTEVTDPASVSELFASVLKAAGRVDILVNDAGVFGTTAPLQDIGFDAWREVVATNLDGAFRCAQAALRVVKEQDPRGGRIINNGSLSAQVPRPHAVAYTATKHAVTGLTRALEGRRWNIACGQIDVGNAATEMTQVMASAQVGVGAAPRDPSVKPE